MREGLSAKEQLLKKMSPQIHSNEAAATPAEGLLQDSQPSTGNITPPTTARQA
jgi:hypothetical protein